MLLHPLDALTIASATMLERHRAAEDERIAAVVRRRDARRAPEIPSDPISSRLGRLPSARIPRVVRTALSVAFLSIAVLGGSVGFARAETELGSASAVSSARNESATPETPVLVFVIAVAVGGTATLFDRFGRRSR